MASKKFNALIEISVLDHTAAALGRIEKRLDKLDPDRPGRKKKTGRLADLAAQADVMEAAAERVARVVSKPIKKFAAFEEQMDSVAAATFDLTKSMDAAQVTAMDAAVAELSKSARQLGADTKYSATEAAAGMDILAKTFDGGGDDFQKAKDVVAAMPGILNLAAASNKSIEQAADVATEAMSQFGLKAGEIERISDVVVKTANSTSTGLLDLGEAFSKSGSLARDAGIDIETTAAMLGVLGNKGIKGSIAGTGLASVFSNVQSGMKKQRSALAAVGINVADKKGNLRPFIEILEEMGKAADKKFGVGKGGVKRDRWLQGLMGGGIDKSVLSNLMAATASRELQTLIKANKEAAGTAKTVAAAMSDNTAGAAKELDSALEELQLTIGEQVTPRILEWTKGAKSAVVEVTAWTKENPELTKALGALAVALGVVAVVTKVVTVAMMVNPIVAIVTGIALAAYLIYEHWDGVSAFFEKHWGKVTTVFAPFMIMLGPIIGAAKLLMDNWEPIRDFFTGLWETVTAGFNTAMEGILAGIGWVGDKIKEFRALTMGPEEAARQAAEAEAAARAASNETYGGLFSEESGGTTSRGGVGDWGAGIGAGTHNLQGRMAANSAEYAAGELMKAANYGAYESYGPAAPTTAQLAEQQRVAASEAAWLADNQASIPGAARADDMARTQGGWDPTSGKRFSGDLKITIDSEGKVAKTTMRSSGDPDFAVRMNAGGQ